MADLEGAGGDTLAKLKELVEQIDRAHQKFASLGEKVSEAATQVQSDWARLNEQVGSFLEAVQEQQGALSTEVQEATQALSALDGAVGEAQAEAEGELDTARDQVTSFGDEVTATEQPVGGLVESVDSAFEGLSEQAGQVQQQLERALESARDFLQDQVVSDLKALQESLRDSGDVVVDALGDCEDALRESYEEWAAGLDEVQSTVEEAFSEAAEHLEENVDLAFDECLDRHTEALSEFAQQVDDLKGVLDELGQAGEACGEVAEEAVGRHQAQMEGAHAGLEAVQAKLAEIKALLGQYTFVQI